MKQYILLQWTDIYQQYILIYITISKIYLGYNKISKRYLNPYQEDFWNVFLISYTSWNTNLIYQHYLIYLDDLQYAQNIA